MGLIITFHEADEITIGPVLVRLADGAIVSAEDIKISVRPRNGTNLTNLHVQAPKELSIRSLGKPGRTIVAKPLQISHNADTRRVLP